MTKINLTVRYAETDKMGIVHHSNYFIWFEAARTELIKKIGISYSDIENKYGIYLPLISCGCSFKKPCFYEDDVCVSACIDTLSETRIKFYYEVIKDEQVCAKGYTEHAFVNRDFKPINLKKKCNKIYELFVKLSKL